MPKYYVFTREALRQASLATLEGDDATAAIKNATSDVRLPPRVALIDADAATDMLVVNPGESSLPTVTRTLVPPPPAAVTASFQDPSAVVTWHPVEDADEYAVSADGVEVARVAQGLAPRHAQAITKQTQFTVASVAGTTVGPCSAPVAAAPPVDVTSLV